MIEIRQEQVRSLDGAADEAFVEKMRWMARSELAVWVEDQDDEVLRERIRTGMARARSHGFTWESSLGTFVSLMLRFSPNFDEHPSCAAVLARNDVESESRANLLYSDVSPSDWAEIEANYDPSGWLPHSRGPVL